MLQVNAFTALISMPHPPPPGARYASPPAHTLPQQKHDFCNSKAYGEVQPDDRTKPWSPTPLRDAIIHGATLFSLPSTSCLHPFYSALLA